LKDEEKLRVLRILDANANRAAEGLRTIEEVARLVREDAVTAEWMKNLRHALAALSKELPRHDRLRARSAETDAGIAMSTSSEVSRLDFAAVVSAAAERTTQSMRCLEEFSKFLGGELGERFKQLRYDAYDVLAKAELRLAQSRASMQGQLYLLIDCSKPLEAFVAYIRQLTEAGVEYFQLRDKSAEGAELVQYACAAVSCLDNSPAQLIVNDRVDIALASGAWGVHLGQEDMSLQDAQRIAQGRLAIGVSTHNLEQAVEAEQGGADYIGCGPTFNSQTKPFEEFAGLAFLAEIAQGIRIPAFAIGGIDLTNVASVISAGCRRIAVSHAIHGAEHPVLAANALHSILQESQSG
jgi:thiamine-phosphate pyrophosphorylase